MVSPYLERPLRTYQEALKARSEREADGVPPAAGDENRSDGVLAQIAHGDAAVIAAHAAIPHALDIGDVLADDMGFGSGAWAQVPVIPPQVVDHAPLVAFTILVEPDPFDLCTGLYPPA